MTLNKRIEHLNDSLRQDIAKGMDDAISGRVKEIYFADLKQQGRQLLQTRKSAA